VCNKTADIYVASCVETGGIYHYRFIEGEYRFVDVTKMDRPMYMVIENRKMYVVLRAPFRNRESGVIVYDIDENGQLNNPSEVMGTHGEVACHIAVHKQKIYCANYLSGSVVMLPDRVVKHTGAGKHPTRQEGPHVHFVGATPEGRYLCVTDLGLDRIFLYHPDLTLYTSVKVAEGCGVRHLAFSEDGKYLFAVNELASTVAVFAYCSEGLKFVDSHSTLPSGFDGESTASAIRVREGMIYVSNRGHDSIAVMQFKHDRLELINHIDCGGKTPRDFIFFDQYLLCANQDSNDVAVFEVGNDFRTLEKLNVEMPVCVCAIEE